MAPLYAIQKDNLLLLSQAAGMKRYVGSADRQGGTHGAEDKGAPETAGEVELIRRQRNPVHIPSGTTANSLGKCAGTELKD